MDTNTKRRRRPPQMSLGFMMLMMVIFAVMSAGLFYASQVPAVQDDLEILFGGDAAGPADSGHAAHIVFIMFTFSSPLLLAALLGMLTALFRLYEQRRG
jgi:hypothetical protein